MESLKGWVSNVSTTIGPDDVQDQIEQAASADLAKQLSSTPNSKKKTSKKSAASKAWNRAMKLIRRIHLYSGLFMFPWVLLYGFTGWFFNHPRYFTGDQFQSFAAASVVDGELSRLPSAEKIAELAVEEINLASFMVDGPEVELAPNSKARFDRYMSFNVNGEKQTHTVTLHPVTGDGSVRTTILEEPTPETEDDGKPEVVVNPLQDVTEIELAENTQTAAAELVPKLLEELDLESDEAFTGRFSSSVVFTALVDGRPCDVTYNMGNGSVAARSHDAPKNSLQTKSFLQRLHLSRGYTPNMNTRTWWAISVDAMFLSMVFWGVSGIVMWWQIKRTRTLGTAFLIASLICATWLTVGMHEELSARGRRGRGGGGRRPVAILGRITAPSKSPSELNSIVPCCSLNFGWLSMS